MACSAFNRRFKTPASVVRIARDLWKTFFRQKVDRDIALRGGKREGAGQLPA
jgi:hypothetical protein